MESTFSQLGSIFPRIGEILDIFREGPRLFGGTIRTCPLAPDQNTIMPPSPVALMVEMGNKHLHTRKYRARIQPSLSNSTLQSPSTPASPIKVINAIPTDEARNEAGGMHATRTLWTVAGSLNYPQHAKWEKRPREEVPRAPGDSQVDRKKNGGRNAGRKGKRSSP